MVSVDQRSRDGANDLFTHMDLMRGERAVELPIGNVNHLDHVRILNTGRRMQIDADTPLLGIFGHARVGAIARFRVHGHLSVNL